MGLGGATAPAPAAGPGGGAPPATPPAGGGAGAGMMMQASWNADPEVWVRTGSADFNRAEGGALPVGFTCPNCGNRHASNHRETTLCLDCGTMAKSKIAVAKNDPTKVRVSIMWPVS